ncbi:IS110 family transposase [Actinomycetospora sp. CA-084318]|uniref:IS110 family transposase n=1 Tax=Actinomycetospora sp. CA-084318 TaxID=3239892 RepID=UPI003D954185
MVLTVGVDVHKGSHTAVMVDQVGARQASKTVKATDAGHLELTVWARAQATQLTGSKPGETGGVCWAVEDCRHVSTRLERALLATGARVVRVPPKLMAGTRASARTRGKSDPIDALAVARAALREPDLPVAEHDPESRELKLLVDHRESLLGERTAKVNRLRWHLHGLDPELHLPARGLGSLRRLDWLTAHLAEAHTGLAAELAAELIGDIRRVTVRIRALEREITARTQALAPQLLDLDGCAALTAAKILGETANITRFRSEACYAMHAGVAPVPASSGRSDRHRLARGGNRQLNAALHRIARTQARMPDSLGHAYYQRRIAGSDQDKDAIRALKRRLARVVYNLLQPTVHDHERAAA